MSFNSLDFLIFFPVVALLYFLLPQRFRWMLILASSCVFYMAFIPYFIFILGFTILVDYIAGLLIEKAEGPSRKRYLILSLAANIGILFVFKYFNFFNANLSAIASFLHWNYSLDALSVILPLGLSFHTFQSMSYTIEVYHRRQIAERHLGIFASFVMFYPQLVAGPIERPQNLLHQFYQPFRFSYSGTTSGLKKMLFGFLKKCVVADGLAPLVNAVYGDPTSYSGPPLVLATLCFALQIYCDFSGYSDIARGAAEVMGFKLMRNFDQPYLAKSIQEFWKRWHISLSTWFKDYLYIPLGGNRVPPARRNLNLMLTFLASGVWHGANWTFIVWGFLHGAYLFFGSVSANARKSAARAMGLDRWPALSSLLAMATTFALVSFAWIFFRARDLSEAIYIATHLFSGWGELLAAAGRPGLLAAHIRGWHMDITSAVAPMLTFFALESAHLMYRRGIPIPAFNSSNRGSRWLAYYSIVLWILILGRFGHQEFIYFQF